MNDIDTEMSTDMVTNVGEDVPEPTQDVDKKEDIEVLLQKVRTEEKAKLYSQIEKAKKEILAKNNLVGSLQEKIKEYEVKMSSIDSLVPKLPEIKGVDDILSITNLTGQGVAELMAKVEYLETMSKENVELSNKLTELQKNVDDYKLGIELAETRKNLVQDLDEEFRDLLKGNSVKELEETHKILKDKQDKIITKYRPNNPLPMPTGDMIKEAMGVSGKKIKDMSDAEYAKVREAIGIGK